MRVFLLYTLCCCITFLIVIHLERKVGKPISNWEESRYVLAALVCGVWPASWLLVLICGVSYRIEPAVNRLGKALTKERNWRPHRADGNSDNPG